MRRLFAWTAGVVGIAALARVVARARRRYEMRPVDAAPRVDERAEALRRKLSETRASAAAPAPAGDVVAHGALAAETSVASRPDEPAPDRSESIEERRARVHAKAQEVIDAMQEALE